MMGFIQEICQAIQRLAPAPPSGVSGDNISGAYLATKERMMLFDFHRTNPLSLRVAPARSGSQGERDKGSQRLGVPPFKVTALTDNKVMNRLPDKFLLELGLCARFPPDKSSGYVQYGGPLTGKAASSQHFGLRRIANPPYSSPAS